MRCELIAICCAYYLDSYCNSVLQCLYFSQAFRQNVIDYPRQPTSDNTSSASSGKPTLGLDTDITALPAFPAPDGATTPKPFVNGQAVVPVQSPRVATTSLTNPIITASQSKDTFDNRKKAIMAAGPHVRLQQPRFDHYGMSESLFTSLKDLFEAVIAHDSRMGVIVPTRFIEVLRENFIYFKEPVHHDAHEFLNLLLNDVVEQVETHTKKLSQTANGSAAEEKLVAQMAPQTKAWVHELFEGTLTSETRCLTCENVSQRDEAFLDLSVDLEEHTSVTSCLAKFSEEEMLCEKNKFHCEKCCSLQEAEKRMKIKRLPKVLALHLKRFKWIDNGLKKLFDRVVYPFFLRIQNTTDDAVEPDRLYELYAVLVHLGTTPYHGHYVSIIKTKDRGWLLFDDELVLPVDASYVRRYFGGETGNSACAYVLFYQETSEEAIVREQDFEDPFSQDSMNANHREDIPSSPTEETPAPFESIPQTLKTPTTELPMPLRTPTTEIAVPQKTPTTEEQTFMAHLENPTQDTHFSHPPHLAPVNRFSSDEPTVAGSEPPTRSNARASLDKLITSGTDEQKLHSKSAEKPLDKPSGMHRILGSTSKGRSRIGSLSLKTKPKLFSKHERTDSAKESNDHTATEAGAQEHTHVGDSAEVAETHQKSMKHKASRFALGRKKSGNLL